MRRILASSFALAMAISMVSDRARADGLVRSVDASKSHARFSVTHLSLTTVSGTVGIRSGTVTYGLDVVMR